MARASAALRGAIRPSGGSFAGSQRLALREERPDTAVTAESAWRSNFALRVDGSWRSAATARRWTSSRASGSAMASSSQVRSRADRKTHMLSVPSFFAWRPRPGRPAPMCGTSTALSCASVALLTARLAHSRACPIVFAGLPAARHANHYTREADPRALHGASVTSCSSWLPGSMIPDLKDDVLEFYEEHHVATSCVWNWPRCRPGRSASTLRPRC